MGDLPQWPGTTYSCPRRPAGWRPDAGAMAQLVARFHGMEEVGGSNPPSSTPRTRLGPLPSSMVSVRALLLSWGQAGVLVLIRGPRSISKDRLLSTRSRSSSSVQVLVKQAVKVSSNRTAGPPSRDGGRCAFRASSADPHRWRDESASVRARLGSLLRVGPTECSVAVIGALCLDAHSTGMAGLHVGWQRADSRMG